MKTILIIIGVVLIAFSGFALVNEGISYTREEQVLDIGPIQASAETRETVDVPMWASLVGLVLGGALVVAGVRHET